jgi:hypothetical protein
MNHLKVPFAARASEGFRTFFRTGDFWGCFWGGVGLAGSPSEVDEPESNKSNARDGDWAAPLPPAELGPEECETNFLLCFRGLASASSYSEV